MSKKGPPSLVVMEGGEDPKPENTEIRRPVCHVDGTVSFVNTDGVWVKRATAITGLALGHYDDELQLRVLSHLANASKLPETPEPLEVVAPVVPPVQPTSVTPSSAAVVPAQTTEPATVSTPSDATRAAAERRRAAMRTRVVDDIAAVMPSLPAKATKFDPTRLQDALVDYDTRTTKDLVATGMSCFAAAANRLEKAKVAGRNFKPDVRMLRAAAKVAHQLLTKR